MIERISKRGAIEHIEDIMAKGIDENFYYTELPPLLFIKGNNLNVVEELIKPAIEKLKVDYSEEFQTIPTFEIEEVEFCASEDISYCNYKSAVHYTDNPCFLVVKNYEYMYGFPSMEDHIKVENTIRNWMCSSIVAEYGHWPASRFVVLIPQSDEWDHLTNLTYFRRKGVLNMLEIID